MMVEIEDDEYGNYEVKGAILVPPNTRRDMPSGCITLVGYKPHNG